MATVKSTSKSNKGNNLIGIFGLILIVTSILKLTGVHIAWLFDTYEQYIGTPFATWCLHDLSKYGTGTIGLTQYMPVLFLGVLSIGIYMFIKRHKSK